MKHILILIFAVIFISCSDSENEPGMVHEYPDGILKPTVVKESNGCGNIFVYQYLDSSRALTVYIDGKKINLTKKRQEFNLAFFNPDVLVVLEIAGSDPDSVYFNFCNDIAYPNMGVTTKYKAVSGKLSFSVSEDNPIKEPIWKTFYYVTAMLEDVHLVNESKNDEIVIDEIVFWNVGVGWLAG